MGVFKEFNSNLFFFKKISFLVGLINKLDKHLDGDSLDSLETNNSADNFSGGFSSNLIPTRNY